MKELGFEKVKLVMDRGFYSKENLSKLYEKHLKFLISARMSLSFNQLPRPEGTEYDVDTNFLERRNSRKIISRT